MPTYIVHYVYDNPSNAGPFKGKMEVAQKFKRGDSVWAPFGRATVTSCPAKKVTLIVPPNYELLLGVSKIQEVAQ